MIASFAPIRQRLRLAIRDGAALQWSDDALDEIINEAQREYSVLSGSLVSATTLVSDGSGVCSLPRDFIAPVKLIGPDGYEKPFFSWRALHDRYPDFRKIIGRDLLGAVVDFESHGKIRLFPVLPAGVPAGRLFYQRMAEKDKLEVTNTAAIEQYALYQLFLLSEKNGAFRYYAEFQELLNRECMCERSVRSNSQARKSRFY